MDMDNKMINDDTNVTLTIRLIMQGKVGNLPLSNKQLFDVCAIVEIEYVYYLVNTRIALLGAISMLHRSHTNSVTRTYL